MVNYQRFASDALRKQAALFCQLFPARASSELALHTLAAWEDACYEQEAAMVHLTVHTSENARAVRRAAVAYDMPESGRGLTWQQARWLLRCLLYAIVAVFLWRVVLPLFRLPPSWPYIVSAVVANLLPNHAVHGGLRYAANALTRLIRPLVPLNLLGGVVFEEVVNLIPGGAVVNALAETRVGSYGAAAWHLSGVATFWLPIWAWPLAFMARVYTHWRWNSAVLDRSRHSRWVDWKMVMHDDQFVAPTDVDCFNAGATPFSPLDAWVPRRRTGRVTAPKTRCHLLQFEKDFGLEDDVSLAGGDTCYFLPVNVPLYAASNNGAQMVLAVEERILAAHSDYPGQQEIFAKFREHDLANLMAPPDAPIDPRDPDLVRDWLEHFDMPKRRQMTQVLAEFDRRRPTLADNCARVTELRLKLDEHLVRPSTNFKARTIASVDPLIQAWAGPTIRECTRRLHNAWDGEAEYVVHTLQFGNVTFVPVFGTGLTDRRLGDLVSTVDDRADGSVVCLVVGDDSVVAVNHHGRVLFLQGDFSSFDQAQGEEVLECEYDILLGLGCSLEIVALLRQLSRATYVVNAKHGRMRIHRNHRAMRDTGGPDTTLGNSCVNVCIWALLIPTLLRFVTRYFEGDPDPHQLVERSLALGFGLKLKVTTSVDQVEFLKGTFYRMVDHHWVWGPLPSRFLKMGKAIRNPRDMYQTRSLEEGVARYAAGLAATYRQYAQVPLIRAYCARFAREGTPTARRQIEFMIEGTAAELLDPFPQLEERYGFGQVDFEHVEGWIRQAPLFTFLEHPLFTMLAQDYE